MIFAKHLAQWSIPTVMETIAKACLMALAAYVLPKSDFGILTLAMLIYSFHPLLQLGVVDGLIIKLPGYYVQNKLGKIRSSLGLSLSYALTIIAVLIIAGIAYSVLIAGYDRTLLLCGIYFLTAIPYQVYNHYLLLNRYTYYLQTTLNARLFNAGLRIFFQAPLTYFYGIYGLVIGEVLIYTLSSGLILYSSRIHVSLNFNRKNLNNFLIFGFPVWMVSLLSMLAVTFERSFSAYYFDLPTIADVGLLAFFGALFMQVNGQILSLFSQYSREFFVKIEDVKSLVGAFLIYAQGSIFFYVVTASLFYGSIAFFVIPEYLPKYMSMIKLLPIIYAIFLLRIIIANFFSLLLILGDRKNLFFGHVIFFAGTLFVLLIFKIYSALTITTLLLSILVGVILELSFLITVCLSWTKHWVIGIWLMLTSLISCLVPLYFFLLEDSSWVLIGVTNLILILAVSMLFLRSKQGHESWIDFMSIIKKQFL
jgi:hypothetical protein